MVRTSTPNLRWQLSLLVLALSVGLLWVDRADAQSTTYRLEVRKAEVVDDEYTLFFSLLGSQQEAIQKVNKENIKLLSGDKQAEIPLDNVEIKLLSSTPRTIAVMFLVANYRAFNEKTTRSRGAAQEFISKMAQRQIDVAGFINYGTTYRDLPFTQDTKGLEESISLIKDGDEGEPRFFAALAQAIRLFNKDLDQQAIDLRYLVIISDGAGAWSGFKDPTQVDKKISNHAKKMKQYKITPIVIGYTPLGALDEEKLSMLRQLASRSGGTYREASEEEGVFDAVDNAYGEIYGSHVMTFRAGSLEKGTSHKVRLAATVDSLKLKSPPVDVFVPEGETNVQLYAAIGGGVCLVLLLLGGLIFLIVFIIKRRSARAEEDYEEEYYEPQQAAAVAVAGTVAPAMAVKEKYVDEPPANYYGKLKARTGPLHGRTFYIEDETTTIGSSENNAIFLEDSTVSKKHAGIRVREGARYELHDFGSTNGVFINERRISKQFLKDGDVIKIGETELIFTVK